MFASHWNALRMDPSVATWRVSQQPRYVFGVLTERGDALLQDLDNSSRPVARRAPAAADPAHRRHEGGDDRRRGWAFSRQTLFRRLKAEGVTYEKVLDDLRHRLALHYLSGRKASVNETAAYLVGFSDPASFSRAFKRWTGTTPTSGPPASRLTRRGSATGCLVADPGVVSATQVRSPR